MRSFKRYINVACHGEKVYAAEAEEIFVLRRATIIYVMRPNASTLRIESVKLTCRSEIGDYALYFNPEVFLYYDRSDMFLMTINYNLAILLKKVDASYRTHITIKKFKRRPCWRI